VIVRRKAKAGLLSFVKAPKRDGCHRKSTIHVTGVTVCTLELCQSDFVELELVQLGRMEMCYDDIRCSAYVCFSLHHLRRRCRGRVLPHCSSSHCSSIDVRLYRLPKRSRCRLTKAPLACSIIHGGGRG
jgi:hypothetical protein